MPRDLYVELEVPKTASEADIKKAYRKLALKFHPDKNKEPGAEDRFKAVSAAYEILSDPQKRSQYDQYGFDTPQQGSGGAGGSGAHFNFDFSDFGRVHHDPFKMFEQFFGGKDPFDDDFFGGSMFGRGRSGGSLFGGGGFASFGDFGGGANVTSFQSSSSFGGGARGMTSVSSSKSTKVRPDGVRVVTTEKTVTENGVSRVTKSVQEHHPDGTILNIGEALGDGGERRSTTKKSPRREDNVPRQIASQGRNQRQAIQRRHCG